MLALTPLVLQLINIGVSVLPELIQAAITETELLNSKTAPSPEQQVAIDDALDKANAALMAAQPGA